MARPTYDALFANVPASQQQALQRFWLDHSYTERVLGDTPWRYIAMGTGRRVVLLLPHALLPADAWCMLAAALQDDYRLLIPDGYALQRVFDPAQLGETLVAMLEAEGAFSATIIAHSTGGSAAQWLLHRWPHRVQHLVLCHSPALAPDAPLPFAGSERAINMLPAGPAGERQLQALTPHMPASAEWLAFTQAYLRLYLPGDRRLLEQMLRAEGLMRLLFTPETASLQSWRGSVLALTAQDDPFTTDSLPIYRQRYPSLQATSFDAGGHWTQLLYPDLFGRRIQRFMAEHAL